MVSLMFEPLRIVIVEDEAVVLMHLQELLEEAGHQVVGTAMSADEAIDVISETTPELLLLDVQLKNGSSGLKVAATAREFADVTILFITANVLKVVDDMVGSTAVLAKPFNEQMLHRSLAYLEECVHRPPPGQEMPAGLSLAPAYRDKLQSMRAARVCTQLGL